MTTSRYVVADGLLAGAYPSAADVAALEEAGVALFVDLTDAADGLEPYEPLLRSARRISFPIPNYGTPSSDLVVQALDALDAARDAGEAAYLHCWGGIGRTGTVVGCWLVRHCLDGGDAVATLSALRGDDVASPETREQVELVRSWRRSR